MVWVWGKGKGEGKVYGEEKRGGGGGGGKQDFMTYIPYMTQDSLPSLYYRARTPANLNQCLYTNPSPPRDFHTKKSYPLSSLLESGAWRKLGWAEKRRT